MDTNELEGFFPEREILRARRLRAMPDQPVDVSGARNQRAGMWVLWFSVFVTMFVNTLVFGWNGRLTPRSIEVLLYALSFLLAGSVACVAVVIWNNFNRRAASDRNR